MKLEKSIQKKCKGNSDVVYALIGALKKDKRTIISHIRKNESNGILTTPLAVESIASELHVSQKEVLIEG